MHINYLLNAYYVQGTVIGAAVGLENQEIMIG